MSQNTELLKVIHTGDPERNGYKDAMKALLGANDPAGIVQALDAHKDVWHLTPADITYFQQQLSAAPPAKPTLEALQRATFERWVQMNMGNLGIGVLDIPEDNLKDHLAGVSGGVQFGALLTPAIAKQVIAEKHLALAWSDSRNNYAAFFGDGTLKQRLAAVGILRPLLNYVTEDDATMARYREKAGRAVVQKNMALIKDNEQELTDLLKASDDDAIKRIMRGDFGATDVDKQKGHFLSQEAIAGYKREAALLLVIKKIEACTDPVALKQLTDALAAGLLVNVLENAAALGLKGAEFAALRQALRGMDDSERHRLQAVAQVQRHLVIGDPTVLGVDKDDYLADEKNQLKRSTQAATNDLRQKTADYLQDPKQAERFKSAALRGWLRTAANVNAIPNSLTNAYAAKQKGMEIFKRDMKDSAAALNMINQDTVKNLDDVPELEKRMMQAGLAETALKRGLLGDDQQRKALREATNFKDFKKALIAMGVKDSPWITPSVMADMQKASYLHAYGRLIGGDKRPHLMAYLESLSLENLKSYDNNKIQALIRASDTPEGLKKHLNVASVGGAPYSDILAESARLNQLTRIANPIVSAIVLSVPGAELSNAELNTLNTKLTHIDQPTVATIEAALPARLRTRNVNELLTAHEDDIQAAHTRNAIILDELPGNKFAPLHDLLLSRNIPLTKEQIKSLVTVVRLSRDREDFAKRMSQTNTNGLTPEIAQALVPTLSDAQFNTIKVEMKKGEAPDKVAEDGQHTLAQYEERLALVKRTWYSSDSRGAFNNLEKLRKITELQSASQDSTLADIIKASAGDMAQYRSLQNSVNVIVIELEAQKAWITSQKAILQGTPDAEAVKYLKALDAYEKRLDAVLNEYLINKQQLDAILGAEKAKPMSIRPNQAQEPALQPSQRFTSKPARPNTEIADFRATPGYTSGAAAAGMSLEANSPNSAFLGVAISPDQFVEHRFENNTAFMEQRGPKDGGSQLVDGKATQLTSIKLTATHPPMTSYAAQKAGGAAKPASHEEIMHFALGIAAQMVQNLAPNPPTKDNPIVMRGDDPEMMGYVWTALVILGKNNPELRFGTDAINVPPNKVFDPADRKKFIRPVKPEFGIDNADVKRTVDDTTQICKKRKEAARQLQQIAPAAGDTAAHLRDRVQQLQTKTKAQDKEPPPSMKGP